LKSALFFLCLLLLFGLLIPIAPIIHYFADGRIGVGRNLNKVKAILGRRLKRLSGRNDSDLVAIGVYNPNFSGPDILIDIDSVGSERSLGSSW
jgi:hypothetical protein